MTGPIRGSTCRAIFAMALGAVLPGAGHAQSEPAGTVVVDHFQKKVIKQTGVVLPRGKESLGFFVPAGVPIAISVVGSNSALYQCAIETKPLPIGDTDSLRSWLGGLKNYLPLLLEAAAPGPKIFTLNPLNLPEDSLRSELAPLEDALLELDKVTVGEFGMTSIEDSLLLGLDALARIPIGAGVDTAVIRIRRGLRDTAQFARYRHCAESTCKVEPFPAALIRTTAVVRAEVRAARKALVRDSAVTKATKETLKAYQDSLATAAKDSADQTKPPQFRARARLRALKIAGFVTVFTERIAYYDDLTDRREGAIAIGNTAVSEGDTRLNAAYVLEKFSHVVLGASDTLKCDLVKVAADTGRAVTVAITARKLTEITRLPTEDSVAVLFSLAPKKKVGIALGLSLLYARNAVFPIFTTAKLGEEHKDTVEVITKGQVDRRFDYGLTLGTTWGFLDHRDRGNWAIWLPELTVNPVDEIRSIGAGVGLSWSVLKLGVGKVWTKHEEADPSTPKGALLPNAEAFKTVSKLGKGHFYISVSLIGLPPFTR